MKKMNAKFKNIKPATIERHSPPPASPFVHSCIRCGCGYISVHAYPRFDGVDYWVSCDVCGYSTEFMDNEERAVDSWNKNLYCK